MDKYELTLEACAGTDRDGHFLCAACWEGLEDGAPGFKGQIWKAWQAMVTAGARGDADYRARQLEYAQAVRRAVEFCGKLRLHKEPAFHDVKTIQPTYEIGGLSGGLQNSLF